MAAAVRGGVRLIQYRPDALTDAEFLERAKALVDITRPAGCKLLLNDRADIAYLSGAGGVHLGRGDLPVAEARRLLGPGAIIGYSAHEPAEAARVQAEGADFITYSPIFPTTSHSKKRDLVGVDGLKAVVEEQRIEIPVYALGGVGLEQVRILRAAGIRRAAVVTAVTEADDMAAAAARLIEELSA